MSSSGKTIAIFSPRGGQGVTFLATQLAGLLAKEGKTCAIDLNFEFGAIANYLNLDAQTANQAPIGERELVEITSQKAKLITYAISYNGLFHVLPAPSELPPSSTTYATTLIEASRREFQYTIIDLPHNLTIDAAKEAIKLADLLLVVGNLQAIEEFKALTDVDNCVPKHKVRYILNTPSDAQARQLIISTTSCLEGKSIKLISRLSVIFLAAAITFLSKTYPQEIRASIPYIAITMFLLLALPLFSSQILRPYLLRRALSKIGILPIYELPCDARSCKYAINQGLLLTGGNKMNAALTKLTSKVRQELTNGHHI
jgi:cellulose biosynthesis protein BcsQ